MSLMISPTRGNQPGNNAAGIRIVAAEENTRFVAGDLQEIRVEPLRKRRNGLHDTRPGCQGGRFLAGGSGGADEQPAEIGL